MNTLMDNLVHLLAMGFYMTGNWLIIFFAAMNVIVYFRTKRAITTAYNMFNPKSDKVNKVSASMPWTNIEIAELKKIREGLVTKYAWYANITAIFPLLGILGTVAALVTYSDETMMENFMVALGTTLLGTLCAIISKFFDAGISGPMDVIIADADYVIQDYERNEASK